MTTKTTKPQPTALKPGERIPFDVPGTNISITLARIDNGHREPTFTVTTEAGGFKVAAWSATFTTETEARAEARRAVHAFHAHRTEAGVDAAREAAHRTIAEQEARKLRRMCNHAALNAAEQVAEALEDFDTAALARRVRADFTARTAA